MTSFSLWRSRNSRTTLIVVLLLVSLATATLIAIQAQYSTAAQKAAAEGVLRDYSGLVADEVIRRCATEIGYYGYSTLSAAVVAEFQKAGSLPSSIAASLHSSQDARVKRAATLAKSYFEFDPAPGRLIFVESAPAEGVAASLRENLSRQAAQHNDSPFQVIHPQPGGIFVAAPARGTRGTPSFIGFEVDFSRLRQWMEAALNRQPLVPASLGHGQVTNKFVQVRIRDQNGAELYSLGGGPLAAFAVTKPFGDTYQSVLSGFDVVASIDPQVARQIVIGGLPQSRLRLFQVLLGVNTILIVMVILQLRREMALQKLRDEFVSSVSHELRTPLTQIRMFAETLLLERVRSSEEQQRSLEIIDREARRLTQLVENVLQFSRMERKVDTLVKNNHDLAVLVQEIVEDFASMMNGTGCHIETRLKQPVYANVDAGSLRQMLLNLLDNAVKYGKKDQQIIVTLDVQDGFGRISVDDEGPGIPAPDRKRVFERFQRLDRDRQSSIAGTGIGLSVVRDLTARHEGKCSLTTGDRGGAKFILELPLSAPPLYRTQPQSENLP